MRICSKCNQEPARVGYYDCKECRRKYYQKHYKKNRKRYITRNGALKKTISTELKALVRDTKNKPCMDCGNEFPHYVMEFDHRPGTKKVGNIANLAHDGRKKQLLAELEKCDVVCANCHRERTFQRLGDL